MAPRRTFTRIIAVCVAAALSVGLVGCGDVNAGAGAVRKLEAVVDRWDETISVDSSSVNTLPFIGSARATVLVEDDTAPDRVAEMAEELDDFLEDTGGGTASWTALDLQVGDFRVGITTDDGRRTQRMDLMAALREDDRVLGGFVIAAEDRLAVDDRDPLDFSRVDPVPADGVEGSLRIVVADDVELSDAYRLARSLASLATEIDTLAVVAQRADGVSAVADADGASGGVPRSVPPVAALALASSIERVRTVQSVVATSDSLSIRLDQAADVNAVRSTFEAEAARIGLSLDVQGGIVTTDGPADAIVVDVASALDGADGVSAIVVAESSIEITVDDADAVPAAVEVLVQEEGLQSVSEILFATGAGAVPRLDIRSGPDGLALVGDLTRVAVDDSRVTMVGSYTSGVRIEVNDTSIGALTTVFSAIRPLLEDGSSFSIRGDDVDGAQFAQVFTVADEIDIDVPEGSTPGAADFAVRVQAAWAASG